MKLVAVLGMVGGLIAAPVITAQPASATLCDDAGCVPYVDRGVQQGASCVFTGLRYVFGLDAAGNTLICNNRNTWVSAAPLIGIRAVGQPCDGNTGLAQSPGGMVLSCGDSGWITDFSSIYF